LFFFVDLLRYVDFTIMLPFTVTENRCIQNCDNGWKLKELVVIRCALWHHAIT